LRLRRQVRRADEINETALGKGMRLILNAEPGPALRAGIFPHQAGRGRRDHIPPNAGHDFFRSRRFHANATPHNAAAPRTGVT